MRVGYFFIPPSHGVNGKAMILDWLADEDVGFAAIKDIHVKVAYVQEASDSGYIHHSVYLNTRAHPEISANDFIIPEGWNAVSMYTHNDGSTLMIVAKVADTVNHDFFHNADPQGNIFFDDVVHDDNPAPVDAASYALSPVPSFTPNSTSIFAMVGSNWMNPAPISPAVSSLILAPYDPPIGHVHTSLLPHGSVVGPQSPPVFVGCSLEVFREGIAYTPTYLKAHFPAAWTIISDARISAKNYLHTEQGGEAAFKSYCLQAITEMQTFASASPQPAELGLQCRETGDTIPLDIQHGCIIDMLYLEQTAFLKAMKSCVQSFVEEPKKACLGGFDLKSKTSEAAKAYIEQLTNMSHWEDDVTSIAFTFDADNNAYRSVALLAIIAHRLMRPISGRQESLLTLFPESYRFLPKHLICKICTLFVAFFRECLSGYVYTFTHASDREHRRQLELLANARSGTDEQSMELDRWLNTRNGPSGWQEKLEQVLQRYNRLRGPKRK